MGYAIFSQRKVTLTSRLNFLQLREMQTDDIEYKLASDQLNLQRQLSSSGSAESAVLADLYTDLAEVRPVENNGEIDQEATNAAREVVENQIRAIQSYYDDIENDINQQVYMIQGKENIYEMEKKRLETIITKVEKELENIEKSEASAIERANPKYDGVS